MFNRKKKEKEPIYPTTRWFFDYKVTFLDDSMEIRTGEVYTQYFVNAVDLATALVEERVEADQTVKDAWLYRVEADIDEDE